MDVDTLLSKIEIQETTVRYFRAVDERRTDEYLATWLPEGELLSDGQRVQGHAALRDYFAALPPCEENYHLVTNFQIAVQATGRAAQHCYLTVCQRGSAAEVISLARCTDRLVRTEEGWKFAQRTIRFY